MEKYFPIAGDVVVHEGGEQLVELGMVDDRYAIVAEVGIKLGICGTVPTN